MDKLRNMRKAGIILTLAAALTGLSAGAQTVLTIQDCRDLALENNRQSLIAREKVNAAEYDRKTAFANYFPKISATGLYLKNSEKLNLISDDQASSLSGIGTNLDAQAKQYIQTLMQDPKFLIAAATSPTLQYFMNNLNTAEIAASLDQVGSNVADQFTLDLSNVHVGLVTVEEPIYAGGKIRAYNKVAAYAKELAEIQLDAEDQKVLVTADEAYWQIVSIAAKLRLTENYVELLRKMDSDVEILKNEGLATVSDQLSVKVKLNEAEMSLIKAQNGLALSKMLLCQLCGLDLHKDIMLSDELSDELTVPVEHPQYTEESINENRSELKCLRLATQMYDTKVSIVRSDFLPTLAVMGNYMVTNPSALNGIQKEWGGMWNVGVVAKIPLFHFGEGMNKVRRAQSDALIARYQYEEACEKISLQVSQYENRISESEARLAMARQNMENAEENLRMANLSFQEGVAESSIVLAAQTAWLQAHSEEIDAQIDRIMADVYLRQATGTME